MAGDSASRVPGWPGTYWEPSEVNGQPRCVHCGRDYAYHGAGEIVTRKLGLKLNQQHLVCRPANNINPERVRIEATLVSAGPGAGAASSESTESQSDRGSHPEKKKSRA